MPIIVLPSRWEGLCVGYDIARQRLLGQLAGNIEMWWGRLNGLILVVLIYMIPAHSAEIETTHLPDTDVSIISIRGAIVSGDAERFTEIAESVDRATVILESPGGLVREALNIGATIRLGGFSTMVVADQECFSACGLIWVSGVRRYLAPTSQIGFHAAYREENGEFRESGVANAEIGSFLTHLGLRIEAIRFFTIAGPEEFLLLTPERARSLGIEVFEISGGNLITPKSKPTVDTYADRFISYAVLGAGCSAYFDPDTAIISRSQRDAFRQGTALVSGDAWAKLWLHMLEDAKEQMEDRGTLFVCIETEAHLRLQEQPTGISGPSFHCASAIIPAEIAICKDPSLWAKDRAMNSIYFWVRNNVSPSVRKPWLDVQREWLRVRNECLYNNICLNTVYDQRLDELREFEISGQ